MGLGGLVALALGLLGWLLIVYPKRPGPGRGATVTVTVTPGEEIGALAGRLGEGGALGEPWLFAVYARLLGADDTLREGEVLLTDDMTPRDVLQRIARGFGPASVRVTLPEGFDRFAVAARLDRWDVAGERAFLRASADPGLLRELGVEGPSAEGYLFPDTYRFPQGLGGEEAVRRMVANFRRRTDGLFDERPDALRQLRRTLAWDRHEVLVLASIVEKEAAVDDERPVIARVFLNRLRVPGFSPRRLQADPTVSYGCRTAPSDASSCAAWSGRAITRAMLQDRDNRYNTYRHEGLPPGPICNPGLASIRAVLEHDAHDYLYFVARGSGRHTFSETLDEHNRAVARYREGR